MQTPMTYEGVLDENHHEKKWPIIFLFSDDFGLRIPISQKLFQTKIATSIVSRVTRSMTGAKLPLPPPPPPPHQATLVS